MGCKPIPNRLLALFTKNGLGDDRHVHGASGCRVLFGKSLVFVLCGMISKTP